MTKDLQEVEAIFNDTVRKMEELGVYRKEYNGTVRIFAELCQQYRILTERFEKSKYRIQTKSAQGGMKKAPIVATLESLRKDILAYSDRLCLNPKSFDALGLKEKPKQSKLDAAMGKILNG